MGSHGEGRPRSLAQFGCLIQFVARYTWTMHRRVEHELRHWRALAQAMDDPERRGHARGKLKSTAVHARLNAIPAVRVAAPYRADVVVASVALEVMYDYLDSVTEVVPTLATAQSLYHTVFLPFTDDPIEAIEDEYLRALVTTCRASFVALPSHHVIVPLACGIARRSGEAQARCHTSPPGEFKRWAEHQPRATGLLWHEAAAGWAGEVITLHALLALAARADATTADGECVVAAYQRICSVATLLDHLIDQAEDERNQTRNFIAYYRSPAEARRRIVTVARSAVANIAAAPDPDWHAFMVTGIAAYYLSAPEAKGHAIIERMRLELGLPFRTLHVTFRCLRRLAPWLFRR